MTSVPYMVDVRMNVFSAPRVGRSPGGVPGQRSMTWGGEAFAAAETSRAAIKYAVGGIFFMIGGFPKDGGILCLLARSYAGPGRLWRRMAPGSKPIADGERQCC